MSKHAKHDEEPKEEVKHEPKHNTKAIGVTAQNFEPVTLNEDGMVQTVKSIEKDSFVRVNTHIDGDRYHGTIVLRNNESVDFTSDFPTEPALSLSIDAREFRILAFQKKNKDFNFTPIYSDTLISKDQLKEYL